MASFDQTLANLERVALMETAWGDPIPFSDYPNNDWQDIASGAFFGQAYTTINDRMEGKFYPIYQNETDLARIRALVRRFSSSSEFTESVTKALQVYTFGKGIEWTVKSKANLEVPEQMIEDIQRIIDRFAEHNSLQNSFDLEMHRRSLDDGETQVSLERDPAFVNHILAGFCESDQLTKPRAGLNADFLNYIKYQYGIDCDSFLPCWNFGVLSTSRHTDRPLGYHVIYDGAGNDWEFYPAATFEHIKKNVPRQAKRGLSDWYCSRDRLAQSYKLVKNMAHGAALQAAIAWVEESPQGTTAGQLSTIGNLDGVYQKPTNIGLGGGTRQQRQTTYMAGSILRPTPGRKYVAGPMGAERNEGFTVVEQMLERLIACRFLMPYSMISSDAAQNNYASSLVAEAPFVKAREADQEFYGNHIKSMLWKVVQMAWNLGWLDLRGLPFNRLKDFVDIQLDFPAVATRDRTALVNQLVQEVDVLGTTSRETAAVDLGRDFAEEVRKGAKPQVQGPQAGTPMQMADNGVEQNRQPTQEAAPPAELANASTLQFNRTTKAIGKIIDGYKSGQSTRIHAKQLLLAVGMAEQRADAFLKDADEAKQVVESVTPEQLDWEEIGKLEGWEGYP